MHSEDWLKTGARPTGNISIELQMKSSRANGAYMSVNYNIIRSDKRLLTHRRQVIIWTNDSPGAKMGTWKCLRVQGFMIDSESIGVLKEIKLGCHDGNLGELFLFA